MALTPAIPTLVLAPGDEPLDYRALYAVAIAYAHSGLLISAHGKKTDRVEFTFPAIVCSSFAIELFMKFFVMLDRVGNEEAKKKHETGHDLNGLWKKISPENKSLIAGMFGNNTDKPFLNAPERRIEVFEKALKNIGDKPFVKWRYIHEFRDTELVSHAAISNVLHALGSAADYAMKQRRKPASDIEASASDNG